MHGRRSRMDRMRRWPPPRRRLTQRGGRSRGNGRDAAAPCRAARGIRPNPLGLRTSPRLTISVRISRISIAARAPSSRALAAGASFHLFPNADRHGVRNGNVLPLGSILPDSSVPCLVPLSAPRLHHHPGRTYRGFVRGPDGTRLTGRGILEVQSALSFPTGSVCLATVPRDTSEASIGYVAVRTAIPARWLRFSLGACQVPAPRREDQRWMRRFLKPYFLALGWPGRE
jgi:hypothetical protein